MNTMLSHPTNAGRGMRLTIGAAAVVGFALLPAGRAVWLVTDCVKTLAQAAPIAATGPQVAGQSHSARIERVALRRN